MKQIVALIPAFNEEASIAETIGSARAGWAGLVVVVVDDGSTDGTYVMAHNAGAIVVRTPGNLGKGGALNYGLGHLPEHDVVIFLDADLGKCAKQVVGLIEPLLEGRADMTIASFPPAKRKGGFGFVKRLARDGIFKQTGTIFASPISGQRAMLRAVAEVIMPIESGYGAEVAMTIDALRNGFVLLEVPLEMTHRETGRDLQGFLHRGRQYLDIKRALAKRKKNG